MSKGDIVLGVQFQGDTSELNRQIKNIGSLTRAELQSLNAQLGGEVVKKLVIRTEVDSSGAKKQVAEYKELLTVTDALLNKQRQIEKIEPGSATSLRQQVNQAKQARDEIAKYGEGIGRLGGKVRIVNENWAAQDQKVKSLQRSLDLATASGFWDVAKTNLNAEGFISFANGLTQITNGLQAASILVGQLSSSVNALINSLGAIQSFKLSFEAIGQGAGGAGLALSESSEIASGLGVDLNTVRESFKQLTPVVTNSGGTIGDVSNIVESLSSRFAAFGISGDKARRVTNGVIQAFAKGKLMAEELTQQISEADPAFKTDLAGAIGVSVKQLEALVKAGEITTDVLIEKLPKVGKSGLLFGRLGVSAVDAAGSLTTAGTTVDQVRSKINTINQLSLERFSKSIEPILFSFIKLQAVVTDFLDGISRVEGIKSLGEIFGRIGANLTEITSIFLEAGKNILVAVGAIAQLVNLLLKFPGVAEIVSLAITAKIIGSFTAMTKAFSASGLAATSWGRTLASLTSLNGIGNKISSFTDKITGNKQAIKGLEAQNENYVRKSETAQNRLDRIQQRFAQNQEKLSYLKAPGQLGLPNITGIQQLEAQQSRLRRISEKLTEVINTNGAAFQVNAGKIDQLKVKTNAAGLAMNAFGSAAKAIGGIATGLATALGPVGVALLAISVLTSAFSSATKESSSIIEAAKQRVGAYKQAIVDLGTSPVKLEKPIEGAEVIWQSLGNTVADVKDSITGARKILKFPEGPGLGDAEVEIQTFTRTLDASVQSIQLEGAALISLADAADKLAKKGGKGVELKVTAATGQAQAGLESLENKIKVFKDQKVVIQAQIKAATPGSVDYAKNERELIVLNQAISESEKAYALAKQKVDALSASQGLLTNKQKESIPTVSILSELIKNYKDQLSSGLNPEVNAQKWAEQSAKIIDTQRELDRLNATGATIIIEVIEKTKAGGVAASLSQLEYYIEQLNLKKISIPIGSSDISEVIEKINYVNQLKDAGNRSSAELERTLSQSVFDYRLSKIKEEQDARNQFYDNEIASLQELGPAEKALQDQRRAELRERALAGDLEAAAQLERITREEKITELRKEQSRLNKLSAEEVKTIQAQQAAIIKAGKDEELKAIREVLEARRLGVSIIQEGVAPSVGIANQMSNAADSAERISASIRSLDGFTANINVTQTPSRWTGGPTVGGQTYQVNELGQEGFLSSGGRLSAINKPKNALWRAPGSGTVIPAHIWSDLNAPMGGVPAATQRMPAVSGGNGFQRIIQAIRSSLPGANNSNEAIHELASVQARQALEIGKLSHAVNRLADKDQSVNVSVRNTGTAAYLEAVNRRI